MGNKCQVASSPSGWVDQGSQCEFLNIPRGQYILTQVMQNLWQNQRVFRLPAWILSEPKKTQRGWMSQGRSGLLMVLWPVGIWGNGSKWSGSPVARAGWPHRYLSLWTQEASLAGVFTCLGLSPTGNPPAYSEVLLPKSLTPSTPTQGHGLSGSRGIWGPSHQQSPPLVLSYFPNQYVGAHGARIRIFPCG